MTHVTGAQRFLGGQQRGSRSVCAGWWRGGAARAAAGPLVGCLPWAPFPAGRVPGCYRRAVNFFLPNSARFRL
jgi:hypothetical protein